MKPSISAQANALHLRLSPMIGRDEKDTTLLMMICRKARSHHRLAEIHCNQGLTPEQEKNETRIENQINGLLKSIHPDMGAIFQGDPRGATVKITLPKEWQHLYDCFGNEGVCVS